MTAGRTLALPLFDLVDPADPTRAHPGIWHPPRAPCFLAAVLPGPVARVATEALECPLKLSGVQLAP